MQKYFAFARLEYDFQNRVDCMSYVILETQYGMGNEVKIHRYATAEDREEAHRLMLPKTLEERLDRLETIIAQNLGWKEVK